MGRKAVVAAALLLVNLFLVLSTATKTETGTGGWVLWEPGLLVLDEDQVTTLLPARPCRLLILLHHYAEIQADVRSRGPPEVLKLFTPGYSVPSIVRIIPDARVMRTGE